MGMPMKTQRFFLRPQVKGMPIPDFERDSELLIWGYPYLKFHLFPFRFCQEFKESQKTNEINL
jgi:hypothetical protein